MATTPTWVWAVGTTNTQELTTAANRVLKQIQDAGGEVISTAFAARPASVAVCITYRGAPSADDLRADQATAAGGQ